MSDEEPQKTSIWEHIGCAIAIVVIGGSMILSFGKIINDVSGALHLR